MLVTIYFGESVIANEVLCATKGHGMGWGAVALGFGMSFGMAIMMVGFISARLNPAMALAELILGSINGYVMLYYEHLCGVRVLVLCVSCPVVSFCSTPSLKFSTTLWRVLLC